MLEYSSVLRGQLNTTIHRRDATMKEAKASTTAAYRLMSKRQRAHEMNHRLITVRNELAETLERMIGIGAGPFELANSPLTWSVRSKYAHDWRRSKDQSSSSNSGRSSSWSMIF
jgi:hypothetical protein